MRSGQRGTAKVRSAVLVVFLQFLSYASVSSQSVGPYLYVVSPGEARRGELYVNYDTGYGIRAVRPFGEDGVEQRAGVFYGISDRFSLTAVAGAWLEGNTAVHLGSFQAELLWNAVRSRIPTTGLALGIGYLREYLGVDVLLVRAAAGRTWHRWSVHTNAVLEKPFAENRDALDLITAAGVSYTVSPRLRVGLEAIGEDLEGFFEPEEAEGGAKLLVGPTLQWALSPTSRLRLGGGPIFYMTRSTPRSAAPRTLPTSSSGFALRVSLTHSF